MLKGKHIILGITGGIAAYKSVQLLRLLVKSGAEVQVVITPAGKEFITPVTLSALSGKPVISEFFTANTGQWNSHVDIGLWADLMVIAPPRHRPSPRWLQVWLTTCSSLHISRRKRLYSSLPPWIST